MKRRKRRARRARRRNAFRVIVVAGVVTALCVAAFGSKKPEQVEERQQETTQEETTHAETVQNPETIVQTAEEIESKYKVFDTMSEDWGSCDLEGFVYYDLPEQYADKYDFKWLYAGKFAEGISEEASTKEGKLSPTTKSIKGSFYERSLDNAYEISVDESNLVSGDTKAAEAIKAWFSKVQEATEWLIQASKYRQIRAVINHK